MVRWGLEAYDVARRSTMVTIREPSPPQLQFLRQVAHTGFFTPARVVHVRADLLTISPQSATRPQRAHRSLQVVNMPTTAITIRGDSVT